MFENRKPLLYIKVTKEGKMQVDMGKNADGTRKTETYDYVTAKVESVSYAESTYNNEIIKSWKIKLLDDTNSAILTIGHSSGFTRGLLNSLANANLDHPVKFGCYMKNKYLQPSLYQFDQPLKWKYEEMPKSDKVKVGSKDVYDDTKVIEWLEKLVAEINSKIKPVKSELVQEAENVFASTPEELKEAELNDLPF